MSKLEEIWKPIKNYEGLYEVSNFGRVKSFYFSKPKIMKPYKTKPIRNISYLTVGLTKEGKHNNLKLHRIVADTFIPNSENKPHINHIDSNTFNNNVTNLEWCTPKENMQHSSKCGKLSKRSYDIYAVIEDYRNVKMLVEYICKKHKINYSTLNSLAKAQGLIGTRPKGGVRYFLDDKQVINDIFDNIKLSDIAQKHNCPKYIIQKRKKKYKKLGLLI